MDGVETNCPYCGEPTWVPVDRDAGTRQVFVSDCEVCCRPIQVAATVDRDGEINLRAATDDETL